MPALTRAIPPDVAELLGRGHGVAGISAARAAGVTESRLRRLAGVGLLTRLAPGCYASSEALACASAWEQHRLSARAFAVYCGSRTFLTGWSAAVTWDLPTVGQPPGRPTAVRPKNSGLSGKLTQYGDVQVAQIPVGQAWRVSGIGVMSREWTVAELARGGPIPEALVVADAVARQGIDLHEAVRHLDHWPRVHRARWVAVHADPNAESVLETFGRFTCIEFDLPMPVSNAWVGADGPEFRVDGLWPFHWAAHEADGALKYDNRPDASLIVARQNEREWRLRRMGLDLTRYGWQLATRRRAELADRFAALLRDNPARSEPVRWWKDVPGVGPVEPEPADWPSPRPAGIVLPAGWDR